MIPALVKILLIQITKMVGDSGIRTGVTRPRVCRRGAQGDGTMRRFAMRS
jgi:hypothetical protein